MVCLLEMRAVAVHVIAVIGMSGVNACKAPKSQVV